MKYIFVDWNYFVFRSIFMWYKTRAMQPQYVFMQMLISNLRNIGLNPDDTVILAVDSQKGSWRKEVDKDYKANRKAIREQYAINWDEMFSSFDKLLCDLDISTPFHIIKLDKLEADDIISYGCRKFKDNRCIIISTDTDYEQLYAFPNVKLFSPISKKYKEVKNPYKIISKKIIKEATDNLTTEIMTQQDYDKRNRIVNLLSLPKEVENSIEQKLNFLPEKDWDYNFVPYKASLTPRYMAIYEKDKIIPMKQLEKPKSRKHESIRNK